MKKEYLIFGGLALVGVYFLMKKKSENAKDLEYKSQEDKLIGSKPFNLSDTKTGKGDYGTKLDCRNAKLKYPEKYQDAVREYELNVKIKNNNGSFTGISPIMKEQAICDILLRNIAFPNRIKTGNCLNGQPC